MLAAIEAVATANADLIMGYSPIRGVRSSPLKVLQYYQMPPNFSGGTDIVGSAAGSAMTSGRERGDPGSRVFSDAATFAAAAQGHRSV
jgi:hypothetical protein